MYLETLSAWNSTTYTTITNKNFHVRFGRDVKIEWKLKNSGLRFRKWKQITSKMCFITELQQKDNCFR